MKKNHEKIFLHLSGITLLPFHISFQKTQGMKNERRLASRNEVELSQNT
jgi:hypothetical protein